MILCCWSHSIVQSIWLFRQGNLFWIFNLRRKVHNLSSLWLFTADRMLDVYAHIDWLTGQLYAFERTAKSMQCHIIRVDDYWSEFQENDKILFTKSWPRQSRSQWPGTYTYFLTLYALGKIAINVSNQPIMCVRTYILNKYTTMLLCKQINSKMAN